MADPLVLLLPAPGRDAGALRDRIRSLGFRCEVTEDPASILPPGPVVILLQGGEPPPDLPEAVREGRRAGAALEGIPLLLLPEEPGSAGELPSGEVDESLPAGAGDRQLAGRLRTWGRWCALARRAAGLQEGGSRREHPASTIPAHKAFMETLSTEMKRQDRYDSPLGLVLADIDGLREINVRYGYRTGDMVIREVGLLLRDAVRGSDLVFHFGGDTFAVLLTHSTADATQRAIRRLRSVVAGRIIRGQAEGEGPQPLLRVSLTFGYATLPEAGVKEPDALVSMAEESLASLREDSHGSGAAPGQS